MRSGETSRETTPSGYKALSFGIIGALRGDEAQQRAKEKSVCFDHRPDGLHLRFVPRNPSSSYRGTDYRLSTYNSINSDQVKDFNMQSRVDEDLDEESKRKN